MNRFLDILEQSQMSLTEFGEYFEIPYPTLQKWKSGDRKAPDYVLNLILYKLEEENLTLMTKKYYMIFDKQRSARIYTLKRLKHYFKPSAEMEEMFPGTMQKWEEIKCIEDLKEFIKTGYDGEVVPYDFEEV